MNESTGGTEVVNLGPAETAKALRLALKEAFPGTKFSVRTRTYAGGSSIDVRYFRGPAFEKVDRFADRFQGRDFDGMTDSSSYRGPVLLVGKDGTMRSVQYSGSFVFVNRDYDENRYSGLVEKAVETAIIACYHDGSAPHMLPTHRPMSETDWPEGQTVDEFVKRCAKAYFA